MDRTAWTHARSLIVEFIKLHEGEVKTAEAWFDGADVIKAVKRIPADEVRTTLMQMMNREGRLEPAPGRPGDLRAPRGAGRGIG